MPKMMLFFNVSSFKDGYFGYPRWFSGVYSNSKRHLHKWLGDSHGWSRKPDRSLRSFFFATQILRLETLARIIKQIFVPKNRFSRRDRREKPVGIEASNYHPQKHQITQHICMQQHEALQTCANFHEFGRTSNNIFPGFRKENSPRRLFAHLHRLRAGEVDHHFGGVGARAPAVVCWVCRG